MKAFIKKPLNYSDKYGEAGNVQPETAIRYGQFGIILEIAPSLPEHILRSNLRLVLYPTGFETAFNPPPLNPYEFVKSIKALKTQLNILRAEALYAVTNCAAERVVTGSWIANDNAQTSNDGAADEKR